MAAVSLQSLGKVCGTRGAEIYPLVHNFMLNLSTTALTLEIEICEHVSNGVDSNLDFWVGVFWAWWLGFFFGVVF